MTEPSGSDSPQQAEWFYEVSGNRVGPVTREQMAAMLRSGLLSPQTAVWREGMAKPLSAFATEEFREIAWEVPVPAPETPASPPPPAEPVEDVTERKARRKCTILFLLFVIPVALAIAVCIASAVARVGFGALQWTDGVPTWAVVVFAVVSLLVAWPLFIGGIFAAIYLPRRWGIILSLPTRFKVRGLIGGFGLIAMMALMVFGSAFEGCRNAIPGGLGLTRRGPAQARAHFEQGLAHVRKGEFDPAIREFTQVIELMPDRADAYNNRAIAHFATRNYDAAWADVKACRKLGYKVHPRFLTKLRRASGREE